MKNKFSIALHALKQAANKFDEEANDNKKRLLHTLQSIPLPAGKYQLEYYNALLFLSAYPGDGLLLKFSEKELKRLALFGKQNRIQQKPVPQNEGLPYTETITRFSPAFLSWLILQKDFKVVFDSFHQPTMSLNELLNLSLPALLKHETTAGLNNEDLLRTLQVKPSQLIAFLLGQLAQFKTWPLLQDFFTERLDLYVKLVPVNAQFSRAFNRLPIEQVFYQPELLKHFNHLDLINQSLPPQVDSTEKDRQQLIKVIKYAMALTARETDPTSFMQDHSVRFFKLERGVAIAIYGMVPQRQLPLESYVGFTVFKNGLPVSYGGAWLFGLRARIGINIFEAFRGGESGYIMCQLLRVYKQVFGVSFFEAEPFQYGLDNPDGITSGAFWFYYRYGFRPVDDSLLQLSTNEYVKIKNRKNYRSSVKTLIRFTQTNMALNLGKTIPPDLTLVTEKVLAVLKKDWHDNAVQIRQDAIDWFCKKAGLNKDQLNTDEIKVLEEVALWALVMKINKSKQLQLMKQMVFTKPTDLYTYQQLLLKLLV